MQNPAPLWCGITLLKMDNTGNIRTFIAIGIDPETKQTISGLISSLKQSNADVKWVTEDQMHFTLKFLGDTPKEKIREISNALTRVAENYSTFDISLAGLGAFPNLGRPRVVWIGVEKGAEQLKILNTRIENSLEKLGFTKESREYKAHLTLGRVRSFKNIPELAQQLKNTGFASEKTFRANELSLFQSALTPKGAIYTTLARFSMAQ